MLILVAVLVVLVVVVVVVVVLSVVSLGASVVTIVTVIANAAAVAAAAAVAVAVAEAAAAAAAAVVLILGVVVVVVVVVHENVISELVETSVICEWSDEGVGLRVKVGGKMHASGERIWVATLLLLNSDILEEAWPECHFTLTKSGLLFVGNNAKDDAGSFCLPEDTDPDPKRVKKSWHEGARHPHVCHDRPQDSSKVEDETRQHQQQLVAITSSAARVKDCHLARC